MVELVGFILKFGLIDLCMECIQMLNNGELMLHLLLFLHLWQLVFLFQQDLRNYLSFYYTILLPIISFILIYYLISGGSFGLEWVETGAWGGLSLTFIVSFFSLIFCFPLGMMLALGRRSDLPVVKYSSLSFIEFWRGVPLITVYLCLQ